MPFAEPLDPPTEDLSDLSRKARHAAEFLKALAHENRLMMLCLLAQGEKSVTELEEILNMRQPAVSQQLARLRSDRLVETRRTGKMVYYRLASPEARIVIGAVYEAFCGRDKTL